MKCSQAKPFTMTSTNAKMGGAAIKSYEKGGMVTKPDDTKDKSDRKMSTTEKVLSYPARVVILGSLAAGAAADQAVYNSGIVKKDDPRFNRTTREGKGYDRAKQLARAAVGIDSLDKVADTAESKEK